MNAREWFVAVVGHEGALGREGGAVMCLRELGARVRALAWWEDPHGFFPAGEPEGQVRAVLVEAIERPDIAASLLRAVRLEPRVAHAGAIVALGANHVARAEPAWGYDDFVLAPYVPAELYARIRQIEYRRSAFANEERVKLGALVVDRQACEASVDGRPVALTAKEFALLAYLCETRGKVKTREQLLARVWGGRYEGGARTVDIHVRRLRAKLGAALPLETVRGSGYKLAIEHSQAVTPRG